MSFSEFVHSISGLITALGLLLTALAAFLTAWAKYSQNRRRAIPAESEARKADDRKDALPKERVWPQLLVTALGGVLLGVGSTILVARLLVPKPTYGLASGPAEAAPRLLIHQPGPTNPAVNVHLDATSGSSRFDVAGVSSGVYGKSRRRIFVLVHPEQPPAPGWWIQPDVAVEPSGRWSGVAWIGNKTSQAQPGDRFLVTSVVAPDHGPLPLDAQGVPWVRDPAVLEPEVSSNVVRATVGNVRSAK